MPELGSIYDYYFQPVVKIKENVSLWTRGVYEHYVVDYQEGVPPGPASAVDMVVQAAVTTLAAAGTIAKRVVTILQLNNDELLHLRWEPLDLVEGLLWEQAGQQRLMARNIHSRVDMFTRQRDPTLSGTTFFVMGYNRDMNLEVRNTNGYALPAARFQFWGWRQLLKAWDLSGILSGPDGANRVKRIAAGDVEEMKKAGIWPTTFIPMDGRQS